MSDLGPLDRKVLLEVLDAVAEIRIDVARMRVEFAEQEEELRFSRTMLAADLPVVGEDD